MCKCFPFFQRRTRRVSPEWSDVEEVSTVSDTSSYDSPPATPRATVSRAGVPFIRMVATVDLYSLDSPPPTPRSGRRVYDEEAKSAYTPRLKRSTSGPC